ncbi:hypothetical protein INS49_002124 [Diaporthe citri]|uniref:uncharacterized protein n=1 Tax=Diaporthe citri TaxID=83186 RepID=UPI001C80A8A4|nr:uncharacterized protein INS49_002124 [Diaporthe citri]KAG6367924.1 hypothetical protein INS49_002124 [Diaporthe citri]
MTSKAVFILVPGAWHGASTWDKVARLLEEKGHRAIAVNLPSTSGDAAATFGDDVTHVRSLILGEVRQGHHVVVVVHSYGGVVGESAVRDVPTARHPSPDIAHGKVIGLALMATGFNVANMSFIEGFDGKPPPIWRADEESGFVVFTDGTDPAELFYHDLPTEEEKQYWVSTLTKQSIKSLYEGREHSYAGWQDVPSWVLMTTKDRPLPVEAQKMMIQTAVDAGASVEIREIDSGHSPMLSRPEETASFLVEAATGLAG